MKPSSRTFSVIVAVSGIPWMLLSAACNREQPSSQAQIQEGRAIYARACANCHGVQGEGMPMLGKGLRDNAFMKARSDAQLVEFIQQGRPSNHELNTTGVDMPPLGGDPRLDDQALDSLVRFLRTL